MLLSHGLAVPVIRRNSPESEVGITLNFTWYEPATASAADAQATQWMDGNFNRWFADPVFGRYYPADMVAAYSQHGMLPNGLDFVQEGDMTTIAAPLDFLGVNYYTREVIKMGDQGPTSAPEAANLPRTEMDWEVYPQGLYNLLCRLHFDYAAPKLYVTENGCSYSDGPALDDKIHDERRIATCATTSWQPTAPSWPAAGGWLFRLVAHGQLRVGQGLPAALRHGLGGLRLAAAHSQRQRLLVSGCDRKQWGPGISVDHRAV